MKRIQGATLDVSRRWRIENSEKSHIVENVEAHRLDGGEREIGKWQKKWNKYANMLQCASNEPQEVNQVTYTPKSAQHQSYAI